MPPWVRRGEHVVVTMRRRWLRTLQGIERDLADSEPDLDALFRSFANCTGGRDMSSLEKIGRRRLRIFRRWRERGLDERIKDGIAENKDP